VVINIYPKNRPTMRLSTLICILIQIWGCNSNKKGSIKVPENDIKQAKIAFHELKETLDNEDGKLWNYKLNGPVLLINRETHTIIANELDVKGELIKHGDYYVGLFPENMTIANSAVDWDGKRWTMVAFPLPESKEERLRVLIHESFHRIQPFIGFDSLNEVQNAHLDAKEGRIYLKLELEALKEALNSEKPENHIKNALYFRQYRHQLFPDAKISENSLEINEGIAEYTGTILSGRSKYELQKYYVSIIDKFYKFPTFVRSFAYFTIPIYGYFMQQSNDKWNLKINNKTNLTDFILGFYNLKHSKLSQEEIMQIGKFYNIDSIIEFEQNRELRRLVQIKKFKAQFLGDSIIKIRLENMNIGFNPDNLMPLDTFGTVYPNLKITDNWGILEVDSCGALVSSDYKYVTISYPEIITDTLIRGEGWKLKLNKYWRLEKENRKYKITK
jgi:hypothetical protein